MFPKLNGFLWIHGSFGPRIDSILNDCNSNLIENHISITHAYEFKLKTRLFAWLLILNNLFWILYHYKKSFWRFDESKPTYVRHNDIVIDGDVKVNWCDWF